MGAGAGTILNGRYELSARLADQPGVVRWQAHDQVLSRPVVVEILGAAAAPTTAAAFRRRAGCVAACIHPGVAAVYDTGELDGSPFVVSELPLGATARQLLAGETRANGLSAARVTSIGRQLADTLGATHAVGLCHGAIGSDTVVVSDDGRATLVGWASANPPTSATSAASDISEDVSAVAGLLYELLCGRPPEPVPVATRMSRAGVPPALDAAIMGGLAGPIATSRDLSAALGRVETDDDAVPMADTEPTPPAGLRPVARPARRRLTGGLGVAVLAGASIVIVAAVLSSAHARGTLGHGTAATGGASTIAITGGHSFDPEGDDKVENEDLVPNLYDGRPGTAWATEQYATRRFGNLKHGVGVYVTVAGQKRLHSLVIDSPSLGWSAEVYVSAQPAPGLTGWGAPRAAFTVTAATTTVPLHGARGGAVLVWITDLGDTSPPEVQIDELRLA